MSVGPEHRGKLATEVLTGNPGNPGTPSGPCNTPKTECMESEGTLCLRGHSTEEGKGLSLFYPAGSTAPQEPTKDPSLFPPSVDHCPTL